MTARASCGPVAWKCDGVLLIQERNPWTIKQILRPGKEEEGYIGIDQLKARALEVLMIDEQPTRGGSLGVLAQDMDVGSKN